MWPLTGYSFPGCGEILVKQPFNTGRFLLVHGSENIVHYVRGDMAAGGRESQLRQWPRPHISADRTAEKENAGTGQLAFSFSLFFT